MFWIHLKYNSLDSQNHRMVELEGPLETISILLQARKPGAQKRGPIVKISQPASASV